MMDTYNKRQAIKYFFSEDADYTEDAFVLVTGQSTYHLIQASEATMERMMTRKEITDYITFDHVMTAIAEIKDFITDTQLAQIEQVLNHDK